LGDDGLKKRVVNNIFDAEADPFDDLDIGLDNDASIHPLTMKGGEENYYPDGFGPEDDLN
jgi:hypothetical protein